MYLFQRNICSWAFVHFTASFCWMLSFEHSDCRFKSIATYIISNALVPSLVNALYTHKGCFFRAIGTNVEKEKLSTLFWVLLSSLNILWLEVDYGEFPFSSLEIFTVLYFRPKFIISFHFLCDMVCLRYLCLSLCVHVYRSAHTCLTRPEHMMAVSSLSVSALVPWDKYLTERETCLFI